MRPSRDVGIHAVVVLVVTVLIAGCIDLEASDALVPAAPPDYRDAIEVMHDVDNGHLDPALHQRASDNMRLLAFHSLADDDVPMVEGNAEVVYHDGYAYVATLGATSGFVIVDVRDPTTPAVVGRYSNPHMFTPDVKVTDDGRYAVLSSEWAPGAGYMQPPLDGAPVPYPSALGYPEEDEVVGITLVDVSDKQNPVRVAHHRDDSTHNADVATIDGRLFVFAIRYNGVDVLELVDTPTGPSLQHVSTAGPGYQEEGGIQARLESMVRGDYLGPRGHDVVYEPHPLTGDHLLYVSYGWSGFYIFNVNDVVQPRLVTAWRGLPDDSDYYHYARPADILIDGRHITIVAPEVFNSIGSAGTIGILDTTDPSQPELVGTWTLPGRDLFIERNFTFSPHNFDVADGRIILASYHAGIWVIDLTCPGCLESPRETGYYLPHEDAERTVDGEVHCALYCHHPFVWGAVVGDDGHIYASDVESGLYVIEYDSEHYSLA